MMKKDSLIYKYKKAMKESENATNSEKKKIRYNFVTKLFFRIFLSTFILLCLVIANKISISTNGIKLSEYTIEKIWNFLKMVTVFNGMFGEFIVINDDQTVDSNTLYDQITYHHNVNYITNYDFSGAMATSSGVVSKIVKNKDKTYTITIQGIDDYVYIYDGLESIDFSIYNYVEKGTVIGLAKKENNQYTFKLTIKKDGKYYDFYDTAKD